MSRAPRLLQYVLLALIVSAITFTAGCRGVAGETTIQEATAAAPPAITFTASPDSITVGSKSTLNWKATGAVSAKIDALGDVPPAGTQDVSPTATTTDKLTAIGAGGSTVASTTIDVANFSVTANPSVIAPGQSSVLSWSAPNATSVAIDNGVGTFGPTGTVSVAPTVTTSYTATATGPGATSSVAVKVIVAPPIIVQFSADPTSLGPGQQSKLSWNVSNADKVTIDNGIGDVALVGSTSVSPTATTTYTLTATGAQGTKTATVQVTFSNGITLQFSGNPNNISAGQSATLAWKSTNANSVTIDQGVGQQPPNGSVVVTPAATTTYTATANGAQGTQTATVTINVVPLGPPQAPIAGMFRYKFDPGATGANLNESTLNTVTVNASKFGKIATSGKLDGVIFTQPLYVAGLNIAGGSHNVVFLGTENDSVYAINADNPQQVFWKRSFIDTAHGITPADGNRGGRTGLGPLVGITGTPVIDPNSHTLYVSAMTVENGTTFHKLHALDLSSGAEKFGGPKQITATVPGTGTGSNNGTITFLADVQNQRSALQLVNGVVYIAFASFSDEGTYHGWIFAYDAGTLAQLAALNVSPSSEGAGIWQAGSPPVADAEGNIYIETGDGHDLSTGGPNWGDSFLKLKLNGGALSVVDWFTTFNQACIDAGDLDLGSTGLMLLPDQPGAHPHLMVTGSKEGRILVIDRDNLGHFNAGGNTQIPDDILINPKPCGQTDVNNSFRMYGSGAYWNGNVYLGSVFSNLRAFSLTNGQLTQTSASKTVFQGNGQLGRGPIPVVSANGGVQGIVWAVEWVLGSQNIIMHAYDATNLANELYNTNQNAGRDALGFGAVFVVPTVINGRVYVVAANHLNVYGLLN
ncbi:MAG: pyrrolo-quinoline quinone [Candidatus Angelobacter sp.]|nr:pyrrolo-quinoline quinone [Candidatus Angelobacter sp.]